MSEAARKSVFSGPAKQSRLVPVCSGRTRLSAHQETGSLG